MATMKKLFYALTLFLIGNALTTNASAAVEPMTSWPHVFGDTVKTLAAGDVNADGCDDLAVGGAESTFVLNGSGHPLWFNEYQDSFGQLFIGNFNSQAGNEVAGSTWMEAYILQAGNGSSLSGYTLNSFSTSQLPSQAGDIDGDGLQELVVFETQSVYGHTLLAFGSSQWSYDWVLSYPDANPNVNELALCDLYGDNVPEIIFDASNWTDNIISVANGSGESIANYSAAFVMRFLTCFDLDGDGVDEILAVAQDSPNISAYSANGTLLWTAQIAGASTIHWLMGARLDNDSSYEMAVGYINGTQAYLKAFDNLSSSSAGAALWTQTTTDGNTLVKLILGDINGDGLDEFAYSAGNLSYGFFGSREGGAVNISLIASNGTLLWDRRIFPAVPASYFVDGLAFGDFDCDGVKEVAAGLVDVYIFDTDGSLIWQYFSGGSIEDAVLGDLNGDGVDDVVIADSNYQYGTVQAYLGNGSQLWEQFFPYITYVRMADLDGDGVSEILAVGSNELRAYETDGAFMWNVSYGQPYAFWTGELAGNQTPELVLTKWGNITALDWQGNELWHYDEGAGIGGDLTYANSVQVGDVNGDGRSEVVVGASFLMVFNDSGSLLWKSGHVDYPSFDDYAGYDTVSLGDLDDDGVLDIVIGTSSNNHLKAYWGNGTLMWFVNNTRYAFRSTSVADVDGDGRLEVVAVQSFYNSSSGEDMAVVGIYEHDGTLKTGQSFESNGYHKAYATDVTNDGVADILALRYDLFKLNPSDLSSVWEQDFGWYMVSSGGGYTPALQFGDVDGDGVVDMVGGGIGVFVKEDPSSSPGTTSSTTSTTTTTSSTTTSSTTSSTSSTTTVYIVLTRNMSFTANASEDVNLTEVNVTLKIVSQENVSNATITVVSRSENPGNASLALTGLGRFLEINVSQSLQNALDWFYFTLGYSQGDADSRMLNESTLGFFWYNTSEQEWQKLNASTSWMTSWVHGTGVDENSNLVWANVSHLSEYTVAGSQTTTVRELSLITGWNLISLPLTA